MPWCCLQHPALLQSLTRPREGWLGHNHQQHWISSTVAPRKQPKINNESPVSSLPSTFPQCSPRRHYRWRHRLCQAQRKITRSGRPLCPHRATRAPAARAADTWTGTQLQQWELVKKIILLQRMGTFISVLITGVLTDTMIPGGTTTDIRCTFLYSTCVSSLSMSLTARHLAQFGLFQSPQHKAFRKGQAE